MGRRIGVLTFHRCVNYGSYWQARALVEGLRRDGREAILLDHRSRAAECAELRNAFQPARPQRMARADLPALAAKTRKFMRAIEALPLSRPFALHHPQDMEAVDVALVGSDEVWNFRHPWYAAEPAFFGAGLKAGRIAAYAASFGCHDSSHRLDDPWRSLLRRFDAVSVRDDNSGAIVREALRREPDFALDPCLQFPETCKRPGASRQDVVIYGHGFPEAFAAGVRRWARERGLATLSLGYRNAWCDAQDLAAGPEEFAQRMGAARAIVTNYFHGCVFALVNDTPFAAATSEYRRRKIVSLLDSLAASDRLLDEGFDEGQMDRALTQPPSQATRERIANLRAASRRFIDHALA